MTMVDRWSTSKTLAPWTEKSVQIHLPSRTLNVSDVEEIVHIMERVYDRVELREVIDWNESPENGPVITDSLRDASESALQRLVVVAFDEEKLSGTTAREWPTLVITLGTAHRNPAMISRRRELKMMNLDEAHQRAFETELEILARLTRRGRGRLSPAQRADLFALAGSILAVGIFAWFTVTHWGRWVDIVVAAAALASARVLAGRWLATRLGNSGRSTRQVRIRQLTRNEQLTHRRNVVVGVVAAIVGALVGALATWLSTRGS